MPITRSTPLFISTLVTLTFILFALLPRTPYAQSLNPQEQPNCDGSLYGNPHIMDCFRAYEQMPGGKTVSAMAIDINAHRWFVEPKYLSPLPFAPVQNAYSMPMVQLPKVWSWNTCKIALVTQADHNLKVRQPGSVCTWRTVIERIVDVVSECVLEKRDGGGWMKANEVGAGESKVVYVYSGGSVFEKVMNRYLSSYAFGVFPMDPGRILGAVGTGGSIQNGSFGGWNGSAVEMADETKIRLTSVEALHGVGTQRKRAKAQRKLMDENGTA